MTTTLQDIRHALRGWAGHPVLVATAVASLALGIGANTALFSVAHALLVRPLPYPDADRLAILWNRSPGLNIAEDWFSTAQYFDMRGGQQSFEDLAIAIGANANLTGDGSPERIGTIRVSSNLLPMLGARAAHGELFSAADDAPGEPGTAILSHGLWRRRFGGDPDIVSRPLTINGQTYRVRGVLAEGFSLPREVLPTLGVVDDGDVFLPLPLGPDAATIRTREDYNVIGKLKRGARVTEAQAEMDALTARLRRDYPAPYPPNSGLTFSVVPLHEEVVGEVRPAIVVLVAAVGFVLLIACANVANLMLARALARRREIAIRSALGATRRRLTRQLLTESVLLALAGGAMGVGMAVVGVQWVHDLRPQNVPRLDAISVNGAVLLFTVALSVAAGVLFGLAPVPGLRRLDVQAELRDAGRGASGVGTIWSRRPGVRGLLVIAELALSVVLLVGAGLLVKSFAALQQVPAGFSTEGLLTFELSLSGSRYADAAAVQNAYEQLWTELGGLPGVTSVGGVTTLPLTDRFAWGPITVEGVPPPAGENFFNADIRSASVGYFDAMRIRIVRGRQFDQRDRRNGERVVIVDEHMARLLWPGQDPIGRRLHFGDANATSPWETVVGVAARVRHYGLDTEPRIAFYRAHAQSTSRTMFIVVQSAMASDRLIRATADAVHAIDADLPLSNIRTMGSRLDQSLARRRFAMTLLAAFALLAMALAAVGTYGVLAYLVGQSTREVGIRLALGATPGRVLGMVLGRGAGVAAWGVGAGIGAALALTRLMDSLLFGVQATDIWTYVFAASAVTAVAIVAAIVPAWRASSVDPVTSLRNAG